MTRTIFSILIILVCACSKSDFDSGLKNEDWICISSEEIKTKSFVDNKNIFKIQLPDHYWNEEDLVDSIHSVVSVDSTKNQDKTSVISVSVLSKNGRSFHEYVENEFDTFKTRDSIHLFEYGKSTHFKDSTYWFLIRQEHEMTSTSFEYILYQNQALTDTCFIIYGIVYDKENWKKRLCTIRKHLYTFEKI